MTSPVKSGSERSAVARRPNRAAARAGDELIEPHDETSAGAGGHEELYVVISGEARFEIDGERVEAPAGAPDEALRHLRLAAAANPEVVEWAAGDEDLDSIRKLPGFPRDS